MADTDKANAKRARQGDHCSLLMYNIPRIFKDIFAPSLFYVRIHNIYHIFHFCDRTLLIKSRAVSICIMFVTVRMLSIFSILMQICIH